MSGKVLTVAVIGYGARGSIYTNYMKELGTLRPVCVCELIEKKRELAAKKFSLGKEALFEDENEFFAERRADVLLVATPDRAHYRHAIKGLDLGYDLLLEKPISPDEKECRAICALAQEKKRKVSVCHVLRYAPFYRKIREIIASGELGEPVTISQTENVGYWHQAHSFIRGNWRNSKESSCMILQKCCHDLDIIRWLMGVRCKKVSSFGSLLYFDGAHAPEGSADFCYRCKLEKECPYDAIAFYTGKPDWLTSTGRYFGEKATKEEVRACLSDESNPYARCVFRCDNDVVDHQVVNLLFEGGKTAQLTMTAFSKDFKRTIKVHLTGGEIVGDIAANSIEYTAWGKDTVKIDVTKLADDLSHHCGGDKLLVRDFYDYICGNPSGKGLTAVENSLESHLMAFAAERSRLNGGIPVDIGE